MLLAACAEPSDKQQPAPAKVVAQQEAQPSQRAAPRPPPALDPLEPRRPPAPVAEPKNSAPPGAFPDARPDKELQYSRTAQERGVLPCEAPDPGWGGHEAFVAMRPRGQLLWPRAKSVARGGEFDLVVHFHGHRPARKEVVRSGEDLPLLGISLGIGAAYAPPFVDPAHFASIVASVEKHASARSKTKKRLRRLALMGWSRGYEAIAQILAQPLGAQVDAVILLDSLHASREQTRKAQALAPFTEFARRAARGATFFYVSHSAIDTADYASTTEATHFLIHALGGRPTRVFRRDPLGLELHEMYSNANFHARGYAGNGKLDHCAHFGVVPSVMHALAARWKRAAERDGSATAR
ncbi:MAG TPA: hypothetical protein PKA88_11935 [Polyangiaceae bacterium]|nr:hypothetical protein [Polyangiaceae bacterium]HMR75051.1 hypothetical protein [Polyangiaceae bacterium]